MPSSYGRAHFNYGKYALANFNDLGPASWLQVCEGREQDLLLCWKCREPLQLSSTLQFVLGHNPEDQRLAADAVRHSSLNVGSS